MGAPGISLDSTPTSGALALKLALKVLGGDKNVPKDTVIPLQIVTSENIKMCKEGTWKEMRDGCNVFDPKVINTDYGDNIFLPETPEVGLHGGDVRRARAQAVSKHQVVARAAAEFRRGPRQPLVSVELR